MNPRKIRRLCVCLVILLALSAWNSSAFGDSKQLPESDRTDHAETLKALRNATHQKSEILLGRIKGLERSFLQPLTIYSPRITRDGHVFCDVMFRGVKANALLQYVDDDFGQWILVLKTPGNRLGDIVQALNGMIVDQIHMDSGLAVFAAHDVTIEGSELSAEVLEFYRHVFAEDDFEMQAPLGMSVAIASKPGIETSLGQMLFLTGNHQTSVIYQGKLSLGLDAQSLISDMGKRSLEISIEPRLELSATLPDIRIPGLPESFKAARGSLAINTDPGMALTFGMTFIDGANNTREFNCKIEATQGDKEKGTHSVIGRHEVSIFAETVTDEPWKDAFGIKGFDLSAVRLLLSLDSHQRIGFGLGAEMAIGSRNIAVAGKLSFHAVTGAPTGDFFSGEIDRLTSDDMLAIVNAGRPANGHVTSAGLPAFEIREGLFTVAPLEGSDDLGVERGIALKGKLVSMGHQLAHADVLIDLFSLSPRVRVDAQAHDVDLGSVELRDANIDILMAVGGLKNRFVIQGYARIMDASRRVDVQISDRRMYFRINDRLAGIYETDFEIGSDTGVRPEWFVSAMFNNEFSDNMGQQISRDVLAWANQVQKDVQAARRDIEWARSEVNRLNQLIDFHRRKVQQDRDRHTATIAAAKAEVDRLNGLIASRRNVIKAARKREVSTLKSRMLSRKRAWQKAVRATNRAPIWDKPGKKAAEAVKYADYQAARGHYSALIRAHRATDIDADPAIIALLASKATANAALVATREASRSVFKYASVDLDPRVAGLIAARVTAQTALDTANATVAGYGTAATASAQVTSWAARGEIFEVQSAKLYSRLAVFEGGELLIDLKVRVMGEPKRMKVQANTQELASGKLFERLASDLIAHN